MTILLTKTVVSNKRSHHTPQRGLSKVISTGARKIKDVAKEAKDYFFEHPGEVLGTAANILGSAIYGAVSAVKGGRNNNNTDKKTSSVNNTGSAPSVKTDPNEPIISSGKKRASPQEQIIVKTKGQVYHTKEGPRWQPVDPYPRPKGGKKE